jgi:hypothetical protein
MRQRLKKEKKEERKKNARTCISTRGLILVIIKFITRDFFLSLTLIFLLPWKEGGRIYRKQRARCPGTVVAALTSLRFAFRGRLEEKIFRGIRARGTRGKRCSRRNFGIRDSEICERDGRSLSLV